jgi:DNA-binding TFAR19-related protein (PDSD5 family)
MCIPEPNQTRGKSWRNVRREQKYKSEENCEGETQRNAGKARKAAQAKTVAKPKRASAKKAVRKVKRSVASAVETVAVEVIEEPAPGVTEAQETRQAS